MARQQRDKRRNLDRPEPVKLGTPNEREQGLFILRSHKPPTQRNPNWTWMLWESTSGNRRGVSVGRMSQQEAEEAALALLPKLRGDRQEREVKAQAPVSIEFVVALWVKLRPRFDKDRALNTCSADKATLRAVKAVPTFAGLPAADAVKTPNLAFFAAERRQTTLALGRVHRLAEVVGKGPLTIEEIATAIGGTHRQAKDLARGAEKLGVVEIERLASGGRTLLGQVSLLAPPKPPRSIGKSAVQLELSKIKAAYRWVQEQQETLWGQRSSRTLQGVRLPRPLDLPVRRIILPEEYRGKPRGAGIYAKPELTKDQGAAIVRAFRDAVRDDVDEWQFACWLLYSNGLRPSEVEALRWEWWTDPAVIKVPEIEDSAAVSKDGEFHHYHLPADAEGYWRSMRTKLASRRGDAPKKGKAHPERVFGFLPAIKQGLDRRIRNASKRAGVVHGDRVNAKAFRQFLSNAILDLTKGDWEAEAAAMNHTPETAQEHYKRWNRARKSKVTATMRHGADVFTPTPANVVPLKRG